MKIEKGENMSEITISKNEYELLVRDSERARILDRMMFRKCNVLDEDIMAILGTPKDPCKEDKSE